MSKLEELLQQYCPNGVKWKPLWSLTAWDKKFNAVDKLKQKKVYDYHYFLAGDFKPLVRNGGTVKLLTTNTSDLYTDEELVSEYVVEREVVAIPWGGNPNVQYYNGRFVTADNRIATSLDINVLDNKYLYYCLQSRLDEISSFYRGSGIKHPDMAKVLDLEIPVPPLPVQQEIVRILDKFTELEAELEAELLLRKKQYEWHRDQLLTFRRNGETDVPLSPWLQKLLDQDAPNGVEWKFIGEVSDFITGFAFKASKFTNDGEPVCKTTNIQNDEVNFDTMVYFHKNDYRENLDKYIVNPQDILIGMSGTIKVGMNKTLKTCYLNQRVGKFVPNASVINNKYLYYTLCRSIDVLVNGIQGGSVKNLSNDDIKSLEIPIPSLEVQELIVSVLDKFSGLCTDISSGLPAEIAALEKLVSA